MRERGTQWVERTGNHGEAPLIIYMHVGPDVHVGARERAMAPPLPPLPPQSTTPDTLCQTTPTCTLLAPGMHATLVLLLANAEHVGPQLATSRRQSKHACMHKDHASCTLCSACMRAKQAGWRGFVSAPGGHGSTRLEAHNQHGLLQGGHRPDAGAAQGRPAAGVPRR